MKEVMAKESSSSIQDVPSLEYSPATKRQPVLFELSRPLDDLGAMLLKQFAGQKLSMQAIYERHNIGTPFIKRNYKQVLIQLEIEKKIVASTHKKGTFKEDVIVTFPAN